MLNQRKLSMIQNSNYFQYLNFTRLPVQTWKYGRLKLFLFPYLLRSWLAQSVCSVDFASCENQGKLRIRHTHKQHDSWKTCQNSVKRARPTARHINLRFRCTLSWKFEIHYFTEVCFVRVQQVGEKQAKLRVGCNMWWIRMPFGQTPGRFMLQIPETYLKHFSLNNYLE